MSTQIFVNLPVKDLQQSIEFFTKLGFQWEQRDLVRSGKKGAIAKNLI